MCDMKTLDGKYCNRSNAYWLQSKIGHANILTCKMHFERAYSAMLKHNGAYDSITVKVQ